MTGGTAARTGAFVAALVAVLGAGLGIGRLVGPLDSEPVAHDAGHDAGHSEAASRGHGDSHGAAQGGHDVGGLATSSDGYSLRLATDRAQPGAHRLAFTITGPDDEPVTDYDVQHEKRLHLVVVRRDLTGFQHVHPSLDAGGTWTVPVDLRPGAWRVLADFVPSGGEQQVLGADLLVPGAFRPAPAGPERLAASVDGYDVTIGGVLTAGRETTLTATVTRDGVPVADLQPYLGARGHLVALRAGDLGYLHVHPEDDGGTGPSIPFRTTFPSEGRYALFLDFRHRGAVRTAVFNVDVGGGAAEHHDDAEQQEDESHEH